MKWRNVERMLDKIEKKSAALKELREHTQDTDLLRTAVNSLANAVEEFLVETSK